MENSTQTMLVRRLQGRDPQALAELYDQFGRFVYCVALGRTRDVTTAENLTQETFLYIWNHIHAFDGSRGGLATWIAMIVRSRTIDYLRSVEGRSSRNAESLEAAAGYADPFSSGGFQQVERRRLLQGPWQRLKKREQEVLRLAYFLGLSQVEIAAHVNQPLGTVKTWIRKGLQSLRAELEGADAY